MDDADPEPRSASKQTYVSESVARKKKRVTDATCLRDMVNTQKQYLARDKEGDCHSQRCFSPNAEHFLLGRRGEEVPREEGKEGRREARTEEKGGGRGRAEEGAGCFYWRWQQSEE